MSSLVSYTPHYATTPSYNTVVTPSPVVRRVSNYDENCYNRFLICNLEKQNPSLPWGLNICWDDNNSNKLIFLNTTSANTIIRGFWDTYSTMPPESVSRNVQRFVSQLLLTTPVKSAPSNTFVASNLLLQPQDIILAVGGRPVSEFTSLAHVAAFMGNNHGGAMQIVVWCRPTYHQRTTEPKRLFADTTTVVVPPPPPKPIYRNPLFKDPSTGKDIPYADNDDDEPEDGYRLHQFVKPIQDFDKWLKDRKRSWGRYVDDSERVELEFWKPEFRTHAEWLQARTSTWKTGYSWNKLKKQKIVDCCEKIVDIEVNFDDWLKTRKHQWKVLRRKRHREATTTTTTTSTTTSSPELWAIDALIQEQEDRHKRPVLPPLDITFLFDADLGCPDDVVANILSFVEPHEHAKLLTLNSYLRSKLILRERLFRLLCPKRWKLPRRPRKPWYLIYLTRLKVETERSRKLWDDLLSRASAMLFSGDCIQAIEKLVTEAERTCRFNVNYISSVVCERNSLLNLAVIHGRHKVVKWLVETKAADIESYDRGGFNALLNAAYAGDKYLVRFLLSVGADRSKIGLFHYTKPLSAPDFKGLNAEGWAARKGFDEVAKLIRYGL